MRRLSGFTLVEMMIALVLGLVVIGGVIGVFLSHRETYRIQTDLARITDNARTAFEIMAREVREAGANACGTPLVVNVLKGAGGDWWSDWRAGGVVGYGKDQSIAEPAFGTGVAQRVQGTEALAIHAATMETPVGIVSHEPQSAQFKVNTANHGLQDGDIVMACDDESAAIFQIVRCQSSNVTIVHNTGNAVTPGNCSKGLGYADPPDCTTNGTAKTFKNGGFLVRLHGRLWYIGNNDRGGRSLYRVRMAGTTAPTTEEIADGVVNMAMEYLVLGATAFVPWDSTIAWPRVRAVRITLTLEGRERTLGQAQPLRRTLIHTVYLRNQE